MAKYERDGTELADRVADFANAMCNEEEERKFVVAMTSMHRTLQQSFTRLIVLWFKQLAEMHDKGLYDLRNEASCKLAKEVMKLEESGKTSLPFV